MITERYVVLFGDRVDSVFGSLEAAQNAARVLTERQRPSTATVSIEYRVKSNGHRSKQVVWPVTGAIITY